MARFTWQDEEEEEDDDGGGVMDWEPESSALTVREATYEPPPPPQSFAPQPLPPPPLHESLEEYNYEHQIAQPSYAQPKSQSSWKRSVLMILVACLIHKYLPPAPPDATVTWSEFIAQHSTRLIESLTALCIDMPLHLGQWCWTGLSTDLQLAYEQHWKGPEIPRCVLRTYATPIPEEQLGIVGQDTAVRLALNSVQAWQKKWNEGGLPPLVFFWTGFSSVGKATLARQLARHALLECQSNDEPLPILEITASQELVTDTAQSLRVDLVHRIVKHAQKYPQGNLVLIRGVEDMQPDVLLWLVRTLSAWRNNFASDADSDPNFHDDTTGMDPSSASDFWHQYNCCSNTVFVLTSTTIGRNVITRALRQSETLSPYDATFLADLAHEVNQHFDDQIQSRQVFDAIVPFGPLTNDNLADILELRVSELYEGLTITTAAVEALLDPIRVEYLEWRKRSSKDDGESVLFMTVSLDGAQVLDEHSSPLWLQLVSQVEQCFRNPHDNEERLPVIDFKWNKILLKWCISEHQCQEACRFTI